MNPHILAQRTEANNDPVTLPSWPTCLDCLTWSADGELAVGGGEFVHVLTRKQHKSASSTVHPGSDSVGHRQWYTVAVRTNLFTQSEWPSQVLAPRLQVSIGEEQSSSTVSALAWSPPGLGVHRRSVLAVLTSNLVLSIWENDGTVGKWLRTCIVNHTLEHHFRHQGVEPDLLRAKQRIRTFAWGGHQQMADTITEEHSSWPTCLVVVANDDNDILVLRIEKESRTMESNWILEVVAESHLPRVESVPQPHGALSMFQEALRTREMITQLSFGPWLPVASIYETEPKLTKAAPDAVSTLALLQSGKIRLLRIGVRKLPDETPAGAFNSTVKLVYDFYGSMAVGEAPKDDISNIGSWSISARAISTSLTQAKSGHGLIIFLPAQSLGDLMILCIPMDTYRQVSELSGTSSYPGQITRLANILTDNGIDDGDTRQVFPSMSGMEDALFCANPVQWFMDDSKTLSHSTSILQTATRAAKMATFEFESTDFPQHVRKVSSPSEKSIGDPRLEYSQKYNLDGNVTVRTWGIASNGDFTAMCISFHPSDMLEYVTPSLEESTVVFSPSPDHQDRPSTSRTSLQDENTALRVHARILCWILQYSADIRSYSSLDRTICALAVAITDPKFQIKVDFQSSQAAAAYLHYLSTDPFPQTATAENGQVRDDTRLPLEMNHVDSSQNIEVRHAQRKIAQETCEICDQPICMERPMAARCAAGHQFTRCGISFLAIQEPGISKYCSLCDRQFLNPNKMDIKRPDGQSLVWKLFDRFDICPYCGGKFRG